MSTLDTRPADAQPQPEPRPPHTITVRVELAGGLDLLFNRQRAMVVQLSAASPKDSPTCGMLVAELAGRVADPAKRSMFVLDADYLGPDGRPAASATVRPGILVMVNEADWALAGEAACELAEGDEVVIVSTLHGG